MKIMCLNTEAPGLAWNSEPYSAVYSSRKQAIGLIERCLTQGRAVVAYAAVRDDGTRTIVVQWERKETD